MPPQQEAPGEAAETRAASSVPAAGRGAVADFTEAGNPAAVMAEQTLLGYKLRFRRNRFTRKCQHTRKYIQFDNK